MLHNAAIRAIFLDRDGVLNHDSPEFIKTPDELHVIDGVPNAIKRLNDAGYLAIVISNQSGIARGLVTPENLDAMNAKLRAAVEQARGTITGMYHCPHLPDEGCDCRKPSPGMLLQAANEHNIDLSTSFMIGDKPADIEAGITAGCMTVLALSGQSTQYDPTRFINPPDYVCADLTEAVDIILGLD